LCGEDFGIHTLGWSAGSRAIPIVRLSALAGLL
jgi:hypothetical protein